MNISFNAKVNTLSPTHPVISKLQTIASDTLGCKVTMTPNFNYYPCKSRTICFFGDQVAIITAGGSGSVRPLTFTHWVTGHTFTIYVEPRSMYVMDRYVRYDYMHGGKRFVPPSDEKELHICNVFQRMCWATFVLCFRAKCL